MKRYFLPLLLFSVIFLAASCEPEGPGDKEPDPPVVEEVIEIPDEHFKHALVGTNTIDTNGDHEGDSDIDLNNDGEIQRSEANAIEGLIIEFDYEAIQRIVDLKGIENFVNLKYLKITGSKNYGVGETPPSELMNYDFTSLSNLEYLELNNLVTNHAEALNLSGLRNLAELRLINDRPYYEVFTEENTWLPVNFMDVNLEGNVGLTKLDITNSYLYIDFCEVPSLEILNMYYLEGGEPEVFDFHCLTGLEWLNISENVIKSLILKNNSVLNTLLVEDIGFSNGINYPFLEYICIDDFPEEHEQISTLRDENTVVDTNCSF